MADLHNDNAEKISSVKAIFNSSGASKATQEAIQNFTFKAFETLEKLSISSVSIDLINLNSIGCCLDLLKLKIAIKGLFVFEDDDFLNPLIGLEKLKYLDLNGVYLFLPQIKILKYLKCIRYINLPRNLSEAASARNPHSRFNSGVMYSFKHNWIRFSKKEKISYRQNQGCELCFN